MPLFSVGIQGVPEDVATHLKVLEETMLTIAGIRLHQGKTSVGNSAVVVPDNIAEVGQEAWQTRRHYCVGDSHRKRAIHKLHR